MTDRKTLLSLIRQNNFGSLITTHQGKLEINPVPFLIDPTECFLEAHLAKNNVHWRMLESADDLRVCFNFANAYISPNWYADSQQVPTWNYATAQVSGKATLMSESELLELLARLSAQHEAQFSTPWTMQKMQPQKLSAMLKAIIGFRISIDNIDAKFKLSQNKSVEELRNLSFGLQQQTDDGSRKIAELMQKNSLE